MTEVVIRIEGDSRGARSAIASLNREVGGMAKTAERESRRTRAAFGGIGRSLSSVAKGGAIASGAAIATLGVVAKKAWDELSEGARVGAQTSAVLKSTGGVAGVTSKQVDALAEALLRKTGIDDEAIKSGQNLLLTFTKVRNEAGAGNDVFNQATRTMLDMSTALGQDTKASAIQLGKALNDPIRGVTALRRVGVSFTEAQRDQIKALVESGRTMDAQKLILKELNVEFGGSAEAAGKKLPGQLSILNESFKNTTADIVQGLLPATTAVTRGVARLLPHLNEWGGALTARVRPALQGVVETVQRNWPQIQRVFQGVVGFVREHVVPAFRTAFAIIGASVRRVSAVLQENEPALRRIFERVSTAVQEMNRIARPILRLLFVEILPRVIGIAIKALDKLTAAVGPVAGVIRRVLAGAFRFVLGVIDKFLGVISTVAGKFTWMPKVGGQFRALQRSVDGARGQLRKTRDELDKMPTRKKTRVEIEISGKLGAFDSTDWRKGGRDGVIGADGVSGLVARAQRAGISAFLGKHRGKMQASGAGAALGPGAPNRQVSSGLWGILGLAKRLGGTLTSAYRPGAITSSGRPSLHGVFPSKAVDIGGPRSVMEAVFRAAQSLPGVREVLLSPFGYYPGRGVVPIGGQLERGHRDHVHVGIGDGRVGVGDGVAGQDEPGYGKRFTAAQVAVALKRAGFSGKALQMMLATAFGESGLRNVIGDRGLGGSYGVFQIHRPSHPGVSTRQAFNLESAARAAFKISGGGRNLNPWTVYRTGAYRSHMDEAMAGMRGIGTGPAALTPAQRAAPRRPPPVQYLADRRPLSQRVPFGSYDRNVQAAMRNRRTSEQQDPLDDLAGRKSLLALRARVASLRKIGEGLHGQAATQLRGALKRFGRIFSDAEEGGVTVREAKDLSERVSKLWPRLATPAAGADLRRRTARLREIVRDLPKGLQADLPAQLAKVNALLGDGLVSRRQAATARTRLDAVREAVDGALERIAEDVRNARDAVGQAWDAVLERGMEVFDARTEQLVERARARVEEFGFEVGAGEETPAEAALRLFDEARQAEERLERRRQAEEELRTAIEERGKAQSAANTTTEAAAELARQQAELRFQYGADAETTPAWIEAQRQYEETVAEAEQARVETVEQANERVAEAERRLRDVQNQETREGLEERARLERAAADTALEGVRRRIQDERRLERENFQSRYAEVMAALANEEIGADEAQQRVLALLKEYGSDFTDAGTLVGSAFASAFVAAIQKAVDAINALNRAAGLQEHALSSTTDTRSTAYLSIDPDTGLPRRRIAGAARGGVVTGPTILQVAEAHRGGGRFGAEAIVPLDDSRASGAIAGAIAPAVAELLGQGAGAVPPTVVENHYHEHIHVGGNVIAERELLATVRRQGSRHARRNGSVGLA